MSTNMTLLVQRVGRNASECTVCRVLLLRHARGISPALQYCQFILNHSMLGCPTCGAVSCSGVVDVETAGSSVEGPTVLLCTHVPSQARLASVLHFFLLSTFHGAKGRKKSSPHTFDVCSFCLFVFCCHYRQTSDIPVIRERP